MSEDVKEAIQQLKQNYVIISKERFKKAFRWIKGNISMNYGGGNREQLLRWVNELEELLKS